MQLDNVDYYSLQVNPAMKISQYFSQVIDLGSQFRNFLYTASAINEMDVVVTVDTSVAHLSGAMGKRTFILLPNYCDWRWFGGEEENSPWYDSVKLFKQPVVMDWISVVEEVANQIALIAQQKGLD